VLGGQQVLVQEVLNSFALKGFANVRHINIVGQSFSYPSSDAIPLDDQWVLEDTLKEVDYVIYLHALVEYSSKAKNELFNENVLFLRDVLDCCIHQEKKGFIYCSTTEALDRPIHPQPIKEEDTWQKNKGRSEYSKSRFLGELEVWRAMAEGLNVLVLSPTNIVAKNTNNQIVNYLLKLNDNNSNSCPTGSGGFIDVRDVAQFILQAGSNDLCWNEKYIINSENMSYMTFLQKLNPTKRYNPQSNNKYSRCMAYFRHLLIPSSPFPTIGLTNVLNQSHNFDCTKALSTGFFKPISISESMQYWFKG
jgi:nucleoside-diphosphate-sugar epimerase